MWIVCNGANKMGSVWLIQFLRRTQLTKPVPNGLQNPNWKASSVRDDYVDDAIKALARSETVYVSKQHWESHSHILKSPGVFVLNILRDMRDTMVSRYYHELRKGGAYKDIAEFMSERSDSLIKARCRYHKYWLDAASKHTGGTYHVSSYEEVVRDDVAAGRSLLNACGISMADDVLSNVVGSLRPSNRSDVGEGKHIRKGTSGQFSDDLTESESNRVVEIAEGYGLREIKRGIVNQRPELRPYLEMTDVGL